MSNGCNSVCCSQSSSCEQSLGEMEFERGIWQACIDGDDKKVKHLLSKGIDVNITDSAGYSGLHYAARNGKLKTVQLLIDNNCNVNCFTKSGQETPLHRASYMGHLEIVKLLCINKGCVNMQNIDGQTCLHKSVQQDWWYVVQYLLGFDQRLRHIKDNNGKLAADLIKNDALRELFS